jgi:PAS domain S-box-containing protein
MSTVRAPRSSQKAKSNNAISITNLDGDKGTIQRYNDEYKYLFDNTTDAIRVINGDFTIRRINQAFADMTGVDKEKIIGKKCWEIFPSPHCHRQECRISRILNGENQIVVEVERQNHDGTVIPCVVTAASLKDCGGNIAGVIEQFRDITEIRHKDKEIKESEDRYKALIELGTEAGEAVVMLQDIDGKEGIQVFVSDQWPRITGYTREELIGMSFFDLVHPDYRQDSNARHRWKMTGQSMPGLFEMFIIRKDGSEVIVELTGSFTIYHNKRANVLYIRDITIRKEKEKKLLQSEERFHRLFDYSPVSLVELDYSELKKYLDQLRSQGVTDFKQYFKMNTDILVKCDSKIKVLNQI